MAEIIGLDIGRSSVKVYNGQNMFCFPSVLGEWRERHLSATGKDDIEVEFKGEKYFAGTLAQNESEFARSMMTDDKAHQDTLLLSLIALHRSGSADSIVVTGLPVEQHVPAKKQAIKQLLIGRWDIAVNGDRKTINVSRVEVIVEGGGAFWSAPQDGLIRIIDAGSKTVNYVTLRDRKYVDRDSGTLPFGFGTTKSNDLRQMAARIAGDLGKKWSAADAVFISGGRAIELADILIPYFPTAQPLPQALYANAIGFYRIGRTLV